MKRIVVFLLLSLNILYANNATADTEEMKKVFPLNDSVVENSKCEWKCRKVNDGYATQIIGFDFANGTTFCKVYEKSDLNLDLKFSANQTNATCRKEVRKGFETEATSFESLLNQNKNFLESKITYTEKSNSLTMSHFLSSLVTLNPNIIDREQTKNLGSLVLKDGLDFVSLEKIGQRGEQNKVTKFFVGLADDLISNTINPQMPMSISGKEYQKTSAVDGFNKNNMAYFSDLFMNMEKIYQHLQILLFVVVGGFYISSIGANKLQVYLENRGENASNQPYLHKFYIPLIMVGTFFMPIPEANGMAHSTMVQNTIRYFTTESTKIADMASAIGGKTYMDKIYKSIGGINYAGVVSLLNQKYEKQYIATEGETIYNNTCAKRYAKPYSAQKESYFTTLTEEEKKKFKEVYRQDFNQVAGKDQDISLEACIFLEVEILKAKNDLDRVQTQLNGIKKFNSSDNIKNKINKLDSYFGERENQLGWINSLITPSSAILAQTFVFADDQIVNYNVKEATEKNQKNVEEFSEKGYTQGESKGKINDSLMGGLAGKLVWMMLPGASAIKDFVKENYTALSAIIGGAIGSAAPGVGSILGGALGWLAGQISSIVGTIGGYVIAIMLTEWTFEKIPLLVCTTASIIVFVSYLVSLCKYFYISPFVVAFALATKRMSKIVDFLVSGIAIFFKPILIVLFIYLALFVHTLIDEIFVFMSVEQFSGIETSWYNFHTNFVVGAITGLLVIFGKLASSYIMWKLIISGPSWAMSLVGIDGKQDDMIAQGIEANLAKRAFVA
ncbi:hypothetical protein NCR96_08890 [Helicobacter sp. 14348-15]|uniref:hypothetical protein n=1 Tax=Helicobacter TaxID=209 RepID=UPI001F56D1DC|nr:MULTISPECIES: hypothetical protein [Helicobacter]MCI2236796.1 hypothetical protein [Helicobacter sp. CaF467b]MCL9821848.1 hypothetical protein [Helicobacter colisuis]